MELSSSDNESFAHSFLEVARTRTNEVKKMRKINAIFYIKGIEFLFDRDDPIFSLNKPVEAKIENSNNTKTCNLCNAPLKLA